MNSINDLKILFIDINNLIDSILCSISDLALKYDCDIKTIKILTECVWKDRSNSN